MSTQARLRDELTGIWQEIFEVPADEIDPDDSLFAAGGTSLQAVQLMTRIEEVFGVALPLTVVFAEGSVNRLTELVEEGLLAAIEDLSEEEALRLLHEQQTAPGA